MGATEEPNIMPLGNKEGYFGVSIISKGNLHLRRKTRLDLIKKYHANGGYAKIKHGHIISTTFYFGLRQKLSLIQM